MAIVLRLVHKLQSLKDPVWHQPILGLFLWPGLFLGLLLFTACSPSDETAVDELNTRSYVSRYRDLDATERDAQAVLRESRANDSQCAEALNNLAFVAIARMNYAEADSLLQQVAAITNNQIELLVSYVQHMRLCQRRSNNRAFYEFREKAVSAQKRIAEERPLLSERQLQRLGYAESEMAIVTSTYYYYVGLERQSIDAMRQMNLDEVRHDTAQYLNYLYNVGAGGILTEGSLEQIRQEEMDHLHRCLRTAERQGYIYFVAQATEALAEHTDSLPLAERSLQLFQQYGDVYQIAGAYRTLASCYHARGDEVRAAENLGWALSDERIQQAPDLVASIYEQLSVVYAAVDDKVNSDFYRNHYLDLQEQTRQDRELEARADTLDRAVSQLNWMILAVIVAILLLVLLLWLFSRRSRQEQEDQQLAELLEQRREEVAAMRLRVEQGERRLLEQRAKVSMAMGILPLIDRILYTSKHLPPVVKRQGNDEGNRQAEASNFQPSISNVQLQTSNFKLQREYILELTDNINQQNDLLTQWIQLRQGELNLHIESFPLASLFDIVARGRQGFAMKQVTLDVHPTDAVVKADRVLTLFMLNTLADNARKFTAEGGRVDIYAEQTADYVEVSVRDTGGAQPTDQPSHGFGLKNCRGIIEKYRKTSQLFNVCLLSSETEQGRGSRYFFRLPKGILRLVLLLLMVQGSGCMVQGSGFMGHGSGVMAQAQNTNHKLQTSDFKLQTSNFKLQNYLSLAHIYADSAYFCNINGQYQRTLLFADSCRQCLNAYYQAQQPDGKLLMKSMGDNKTLPAEIRWYQQHFETNYQIVLDIRNESAVAALALHQWALYTYNNKVYTQLFKEMSADGSLSDYCRAMQQSRQNKRIAVILLLVLFTSLFPAYYMLYYRHRLQRRYHRERQQQTDIELADDELRRAELESGNLHIANSVLDNCLSALKHETMYYPSRIRQLVDTGHLESLAEVTGYYRDLYAILIQQAQQQAERIHLHIRPVQLYGQTVLGDENLLRYLFELLGCETSPSPSQGGEIKSEIKDENYVVFHISLISHLSPLTSMLCRQIVRDHGEATNRRGCGITTDNNQVTITLPRYHGSV